jgi:hypothetical protein
MQQLLDKWERLRKSEYLRPDEKLMLNHCISDLKRFMNHSGEATEMVGKGTAVEWLRREWLKRDMDVSIRELFEQAKEMEKERMKGMYVEGSFAKMRYYDGLEYIDAEQYYNETYGGNK